VSLVAWVIGYRLSGDDKRFDRFQARLFLNEDPAFQTREMRLK
jgi:hypothetical protein